MSTLQKMAHMFDEEKIEVTHVVNGIQSGGEFTMCGLAIPDSSLEIEGFEKCGPEFRGNLKEVTCQSCLDVINYCKSLK